MDKNDMEDLRESVADLRESLADTQNAAAIAVDGLLAIIQRLAVRVVELEQLRCDDHPEDPKIVVSITKTVSGKPSLYVEACCYPTARRVGKVLEPFLESR